MTNRLTTLHRRRHTKMLEQSQVDRWGSRFAVFVLVSWVIGLWIGFEFALQVLVVSGFAAAIAGLRWPNLGLLGVSMLCTLDTVSRSLILSTSTFFRYNTYNYWLLAVMLLSLSLLLNFKDAQTRILQFFLVLLALEIGVSAAWENGFQHLLNILTVFGLIVYFVRAVHWNAHHWYWLGVVNGILAAGGGLVFYVQKSHLPAINNNVWAYFPLTAIFAICLSFSFVGKNATRQMILGALAIVNYFWIFLSSSRGTLLVATVCIVFLVLTAGQLSSRLAYTGLFVLAAVMVSTLFGDLQNKSLARIERLVDSDRSYVGRTSGRSDLAVAAWYMFLDHPFGVGTGGFAATRINEGYTDKTSGWESHNEMEAHAGWMKTLAENGVPGILLELAYVLSFAIVGWQRRQHGLLSLGLLVTLTLGVAFVTTEVQAKGLWFLAAGATVLLHKKHYPRFRRRALSNRGAAV